MKQTCVTCVFKDVTSVQRPKITQGDHAILFRNICIVGKPDMSKQYLFQKKNVMTQEISKVNLEKGEELKLSAYTDTVQ